ncbi:MAG: Cof-type HAD-IIB family hydrolase [Bacteroidota bacterium]|nr:Cof-type HAD-IIB family hydrolase [Bacteroidota bacterium]
MTLPINELKKRFSNIKLIVSDIDGTLVSNNNQINEFTIQLIKDLQKKNIYFSLASQRVHSSIVPIADQLDINIPYISLNGALIQDKAGTVVLNKSVIDKKYVMKAIKLAEKYYVKIALCYNDRIVYTEDNSVIKDFMTRFGTTYTLVDSYDNYLDNVLEIIMSGNDKTNMRVIHEKMLLPFGLYLKLKFNRSQSYQNVYNLEILRKGINKKTGLKVLAKYLNIQKNEVMVFGDWYNDRDLFQFGGTNIALANAVDELKDIADFITDKSNDEDGVGHFLKMFNESLS